MAVGNLVDIVLGSKPEVQTGTMGTMTPEQKALFEFLSNWGQQWQAPTAGEGPAPISAQNVTAGQVGPVDFGGGEGVRGAAGQYNPQVMRALDTLFGQTQQSAISTDETFNLNVRDPALKSYQDVIAPGITQRGNVFSSQNRENLGNAQQELIRSLTAGRADMAYKSQESSANRRLQAALGLAPAANTAYSNATGGAYQAGQLDMGQAGLNQQGEIANLQANLQAAMANQQANLAAQTGTATNQIQWGALQAEFAKLPIQVQALLGQLLGIPQLENYAVGTGGSQGLLGALISGGAAAGGAYAGAKLGAPAAAAVV